MPHVVLKDHPHRPPSGGGFDNVLVRLSLTKKIIKDVSFMCIAFSVKHPQIFWEL